MMPSSLLCRIPALFLLLGLTGPAAPAQQDAGQQAGSDPVVDAARKARAEQKAAPKPKKVFTNDDIAPAAPASTAAASGTETPQGGTDAKGAAAGDSKEDPNGEAAWRKRFKDIHGKISAAEKELDVLQRELNKDQVQYYPDPQKALMQQHDRSDINEKTAKIDAKKQEIDALKKQESDMEDQLRKSGGDPGWAR